MEVVGYTYRADIHCVACSWIDLKGNPARAGLEVDGDPVHPVFDTDEISEEGWGCGTCGEPFQ